MARILIIDDDPDMRAMVEQTLASVGHQPFSAPEGAEGVELYRRNPADLVITDLVMPNQEGIETIRMLRRDFPSVAIIAMSGKTGARTMLTVARRLGALEVLEKPFLPNQLLELVEKILRLQSRPA